MSELYFLRHGKRIDHALEADPSAKPIYPDYESYDPSLAEDAIEQIKTAARDIITSTTAFELSKPSGTRKNIFIHFSPYLRCCQTADILMTNLKESLVEEFPNYKPKFLLLGDFALSEWVHEKMKDKPPFIDSNDAYGMYTPNVKLMKNRSATSNFRPTNTLGPYNGPDISYKEYLGNCKQYFQKLVALYNKPINMKNKDIIIVVSHGYFINNLMSYFINQPIFKEIPECKINFAMKVIDEDKVTEEEENEGGQEVDKDESGIPYNAYVWKLFKDALDILEDKPETHTVLNLETDIVYYKTNFIKKDELLKPEQHNAWTPSEWQYPRRSFEIDPDDGVKPSNENSTADVIPSGGNVSFNTKIKHLNNNPICAAAKDWLPDVKSNEFAVKSDFKEKEMDSTSFKDSFKITNHPLKPISPEVSPNSQPTRNNSVIDLSKLVSNEEIYKPVKLKYSHASEFSISKLNSKVNSQVNLAQAARSAGSSSNSSIIDFSKFVNASQLGQPIVCDNKDGSGATLGRTRSISNPLVHVVYEDKNSYFPLGVKISPLPDDSTQSSLGDLNMIQEQRGYTPQNEDRPDFVLLNRSASLNHKKSNALGGNSLLAKYKQIAERTPEEPEVTATGGAKEKLNFNALHNKLFALSFPKEEDSDSGKQEEGQQTHRSTNGRRRSSVKFIPSVLTHKPGLQTTEPKNHSEKKEEDSKKKPFFYNLDSDDSFDSEDESESKSEKLLDKNTSDDMEIKFPQSSKKKNQYVWFGQNRG